MNFLPVILALVLIWFFLTPIYQHLRDKSKKIYLTLLIKATNTGISVLFAVVALLLFIKNPNSLPKILNHNYLLVIGLCICLVADLIFNLHFVAGGFLFFFGHICYILYFIKLNGFPPVAIPIITILAVLLLLYFYPYSEGVEHLAPIFIGYGLTILITLALGILLIFSLGVYGISFAIGALFVVASDFLLFKNRLVEVTPFSNRAALYLYFTGQFFLALGLYLPAAGII